MKTLKLRSKTPGLVATVDDEDFARVSQHQWWALKTNNSTTYAVTNIGRQLIYLHRFLMQREIATSEHEHPIVHHRDGNGLRNEKDNLEVTTQRANAIKQRIDKRNKTGFRGVRRVPSGYYVSVGGNYVGTFRDITTAFTRWYGMAAVLWGKDLPPLEQLVTPRGLDAVEAELLAGLKLLT